MIEGKAHVASLDAEHELAVEDPSELALPEQGAGKARRMTLNMGPQHPSTHGVLRVVLELDGETILRARPEIGYLHTGIEKQARAKSISRSFRLPTASIIFPISTTISAIRWQWSGCLGWKFRRRRNGCG